MISLSVIIPCFNVENYIEKCVSSLINEKIEIIIINDGSTDNTLKKCQYLKRKYKNIKLINIINSGVSKARNVGIENATGEFIWFVDSDDYIDKNMLNKIIKCILSIDADIYTFAYNSVYPNDYIIRSENYITGNQIRFIENFLLGFYNVSMWNKIVKKNLIANIRFNERLRINEDKLFCFEIFLNANKVYYDDTPYYNYLQVRDGNTKSVYFDDRYFDVIVTLNLMEEKIKKYNRSDIIDYYFNDYCRSIIGLYHRAILQQKNRINEIKIENIIKINKNKFIHNNTISIKRKCALILILYFNYIYKKLYTFYFKKEREKWKKN